MDIYDHAAEAAEPVVFRPLKQRPLTPDEFELLVGHLLDTEMSIPDALRALSLDLWHLTIDDLDKLSDRIARCRHCNTWTRLAELVRGVCPDCHRESR